jgi:UDP-glucuronate 4-epimerase
MKGSAVDRIGAERILLTGAAGFIGFHVASGLLSRGFSVAGMDNLNDYYDVGLKSSRLKRLSENGKFSFIKADVADKGRLRAVFEDCRPDLVIHLAAQAGVRYSIENPDAYIDSNVSGFFNVLEACRRFPVRHLLFASSSSVYGANKKTPFSESDCVDHPVSLYAATKKANELMAYTYSHMYGIAATGLRFFTVYGPWGRPDMAYFLFTEAILAGKAIRVFGEGELYRDFTYVDDVAAVVNEVAFRPPAADENGARYRIYNVGNNRPEKLTDFIGTLEKLLGKRAVKEYLPMQPGDVPRTCADIEALARDFGFAPATPVEEGLRRFVAWYKAYYAI